MKNLHNFVFALIAFVSGTANATIFDFSYQSKITDISYQGITTAGSITGSLSGNLVGDYVENISDVHVALNGIEFLKEPLFHFGIDPLTGAYGGEAFVSPTASLNNFLFVDNGNFPVDFSWGNYFEVANWPAGDGYGAGNRANARYAKEDKSEYPELAGSVTNGTWALIARREIPGNDVPEPGTLALLSLGLFGFATARRRKQ